ncbi:MAG: primosomal protein N' [Deltaproteobacteria bacterium]|nr:primosomal protein N' [Deltaproteobacteria bacterium]
MIENTAPEPFSCLSIAVSAPVGEPFSYAVPEDLRSLVHIGSRVLVPFNRRRITGYVVDEISETPDFTLKEIEDILDPEPLFHPQMVPFFKWIADYYRHPLGMVIHSSLPGKPFKSATLTEKGKGFLEGRLFDSEEIRILHWIGNHSGKKLPWPMKTIYPIQEKGWIRVESRVRKGGKNSISKRHAISARNNSSTRGTLPNSEPHPLNPYQIKALAQIKNKLDQRDFGAFLLYGVTGSGKTEVYFRAVEKVIQSGRQTILMAPEILLAGYLEELFRVRLGDRVALYHSGLSKSERHYQWSRMATGKIDLVIGARSALFAPLPRLGLIIVDEEHDTAYVQTGGTGPPYCARDVTVVRGRLEKAVVILGSGTPSIQSFQNAKDSRYELLSMPERVEQRPMPGMEIVDMRKVKDANGKEPMISPTLQKALGENLDAGNQSILFLNRRGFHQIFLCRSCGRALRCPNCDVSLTFHLNLNRLVCHYCGFKSPPSISCTHCGGNSLRPFGFGTEKMEVELNALFPDARISRMDTDSTRKKGAASNILKEFASEKTHILVGTQMITKGYDFPNVTLVGVVAADLSLGFPDFRAGERTFQLLSQVAGRAGRGDHKGRVMIQTFNPDHYVIQTAVNHDFNLFFEKEKNIRQQLHYPPFSNLACLKLQGDDAAKTGATVRELGLRLKEILKSWPTRGREIQLLGPVAAPMARLKRKFRWQLLIKCQSGSLLKHFLQEAETVFEQIPGANRIQFMVDVDPYDML